MKFIILILCIFNLFLCKTLKKGIFNPAMIYTIIWSFFVIIPCILWKNIDWNYNGLIWINLSCTSMIIGQGLALSYYRRKNYEIISDYNKNLNTCSYVNVRDLRVLVEFFIIISLLRIFFNVISKGFSLSVFYNLDQLLSINNYAAYNRYNTEESAGLISQLFLIIQYSLPIFGGYMFNFTEKKKDRVISILTLLPVTLGLLISNAKAGFIASVFNFMISYLLSSYKKNGKYPQITLKTSIFISISIIIFIGLMFISMCMRVGDFSQSTIEYVRNRIMVYGFGQIKAFDEWFYTSVPDYTFFESTYMWIFNRLGIVNRVQGVYRYAYSIHTNVFTVFRGVINDFGIFGGQIYIFSRGFISGLLMMFFERNKNLNLINFVLLMASYLFILFGVFISPWVYTTYFLMYVLFVVTMKILHQTYLN